VATILHVEDDDAMALLFRTAVEEAALPATVYRVSGREEARVYLRGDGRHAGRTWPDLVFLDLNMPEMDGFQVLMDMKADGDLQSIPVIVLSTSFREADRDRAFELGATSYITKPSSFAALIAAVRSAYGTLDGTGAASESKL
jgi:CheY-like chemotaxis protein